MAKTKPIAQPEKVPTVGDGEVLLEYIGPFTEGVHVQLEPGGRWTDPVPRGSYLACTPELARELVKQTENWSLVGGTAAAELTPADEQPEEADVATEDSDGAEPTASPTTEED